MNEVDRRLLLGAAGLAGIAALTRRASAGPLTPPGGAVSSTGRTLTEIYDKVDAADGRIRIPGSLTPVTIFNSGSYVLTGDIVVNSSQNGLSLATDNISVDLNGYSIRNAMSLANGIACTNRKNVHVRNGRVAGFAFGVGLNGSQIVVEDMIVEDSRLTGIGFAAAVAGDACVIRRCIVTNTGVNSSAAETSNCIGISLASSIGSIEDCVVNHVETNTAARSAIGIAVSGTTRATVINNRVYESPTGMSLVSNAGIVVRNNIILGATTGYINSASATDGGGNIPPP